MTEREEPSHEIKRLVENGKKTLINLSNLHVFPSNKYYAPTFFLLLMASENNVLQLDSMR